MISVRSHGHWRPRLWCALITLIAFLSGCGPLVSDDRRSSAGEDHLDARELYAAVPDDAVVYAAMPHPDDEFQAWSLLEDSNRFTVIVLMTRGERTQHCSERGFSRGWQEGLEISPSTTPVALEHETCVDARLESIRGYLDQMSQTDDTIPGDLAEGFTVSHLNDDDDVVCSRETDGECTQRNLSAEVWLDQQQRGALIAFDLGDDNLTQAEVAWALNHVKGTPAKFGIDPQRPSGYVVSGYYSDHNVNCYEYSHPDHEAVARTLDSIDLGLGLQFVTTCGEAGKNVLDLTVSERAADAAFHFRGVAQVEGAVRQGAHEAHYGWLSTTVHPLDRERQQQLFMQKQTFVLSDVPVATWDSVPDGGAAVSPSR